jgi:hypothetical protein
MTTTKERVVERRLADCMSILAKQESAEVEHELKPQEYVGFWIFGKTIPSDQSFKCASQWLR